jgi:hypothetical protein
MRPTICLAAAVALAAGSAPLVAKAAKHPTFQLNNTTWTFVEKKEGKVIESIDDEGDYITQTAGGKHLDHGTAVMKNGKACFTSKMDKEGEVCWTTSPTRIGHSFTTTSDKGEKVKVTRLKYKALKMPG